MKKYLYLLTVLFILGQVNCNAKEANESEPIVIRLETEKQLIPIYVARTSDEASGLEAAYLKKLEEVLRFDLSHNGMTTAIANNAERDQLASKMTQGSSKGWSGIYYVIKSRISNDKKPTVTVIPINGDASRSFEGKPLTGELGTDRKQIHQLADVVYKALFNADGIATTHVLYSIKKKANEEWKAEIWEADYDGANARPVIQDGSYNITPTYIPPKTGYTPGSFFYVSYKNAQPKIFVASLKDGVGRRISTIKGNQLMPAISRQRDQLAFICDVTGNPDLFLIGFSVDSGPVGKPRQVFSSKKATQGTPTFNPEGDKLAFVSNKDGTPKIYVMSIPAVGTPLKNLKPQLINRHSREASAPAWSPDGDKLAYCATTSGVRQIWVYDFSTNEERQLTQGGGNKENPTWAPNSLTLMYNTSDPGERELYLITINQPQATKINVGNGEKRFPSWEPR
jgi:TolB protein